MGRGLFLEFVQMRAKRSNMSEQIKQMLEATEQFMLKNLYRSDSERLTTLIRYHLGTGGRRVRAKLALTAGIAVDLDHDICIALAASCELLHNASLLHDDIQDGDKLRRGHEVAWCRFDSNTAMCAGTLMMSTAFNAVSNMHSISGELVAHLHKRTSDLICGQTLDLNHQSQHLNIQEYLSMATQKSGSLLALPLELVMIAAQVLHALPAAKAAGELFAVAYQIADDVNDLEEDLSKGNCNIIGVLQANGLSRKDAISKASQMSISYLNKAREQAMNMPNASAEFLVSLCDELSIKINADKNLSFIEI